MAEAVAAERDDVVAVGIKTRLCGDSPVVAEEDAVVFGIIGSKEDRIWGRLSAMDLEAVDIGSLHVVGDTSDLFELAGRDIHGRRRCGVLVL